MGCLKCGREIPEDEVFCVECQLEAQRCPVDPASVVFIPSQMKQEPVKKPPRRKTLTADERIKALKRRIRWLTALVVLLSGLAAVMIYPTYAYVRRARRRPGQNYSSVTVPPSTAPTETAAGVE